MIWKELQAKTMVFFLGIFLCGVIVFFAEFLARKVSDIRFQDFNSDLLRANVFNESYANIPNANVQNYGNFIFTDKNGFRIPSAEYKYPKEPERTVLFWETR